MSFLLLSFALAATAPAETPVDAETRRMIRRLEFIAESANPWTNPYLSDRRAELFRALPVPTDPAERARREYTLARELLQAGRAREAVERLRALQQRIDPRQVRPLLAAALLRLGEQENCLAHHGADSCLLPIRGSGVHRVPGPAREAVAEYLAQLEATPDDLSSRWLLNIASMALGQWPDGVPERWRIPPQAFGSEHDPGRFRDVAPALGVDALGLAGGSIVEDFDGDGDLDIVVSSSGLRDPLRYFRNDGDGGFTERTREAGFEGIVGGLNIVHADHDNDGDADLLVLRGAWLNVPPATDGGRHPNSLLRNNGDGTFADVTESAGLLFFLPSQTAAWADFDNDGWLDLFVGNESSQGQINPCQLFHNDGDGTFTEVAAEVGLNVTGLVKAVAWGDYDNDSLADLYVSRLGEANALYHNDGKRPGGGWHFSDVTSRAGVSEPRASFPTWFFDYDNDGWLDIFVSGYGTGSGSQAADVAAERLQLPHRAELPRLYRNAGDGTFRDASREVGLDRVAFTMGCNYGDLDNDGWLDLYLGTGDPDLRALVPNLMFRNDGGRRFQDVTTSGGFGHLQKGHGVAFADLDHDGDQDVYAGLGGFYTGDVYPNALFENPGHGNHWIKLQLEGQRTNRGAIGARIEIAVTEGDRRRLIHAVVSSGGSFGGSSLRQEIGLGRADAIESVTVRWPASGRVQRLGGLELDRAYRVLEGAERATKLKLERMRLKTGSP